MKRKILLGLLGSIVSLSAISQTITAPAGQSLSITNPINVNGSVGIPTDSSFKIAGKGILSTKGSFNIFLGESSGASITSGSKNMFLGFSAGTFNTTGASNAFIGTNSGASNSSGNFNVFIGENSGRFNTTGLNNMFMGVSAGYSNVGGNFNAFIGTNSGVGNTSGNYNVFVGDNAGRNSTTSSNNLFLGAASGYNNISGGFNAFIGTSSGIGNTNGAYNVFIGENAGAGNTSGSTNTYIGSNSGGNATISNAAAIGANAAATLSNTVVLGNAATTITGTGIPNSSGLRFANLNSGTTPRAVVGGTGVLSVDGSGNVVLVSLVGGATISSVGGPVAEKTWKEQDGYLYNNSTNGVVINGTGLDGNSLIVKGGVLSKEVNVKVEGSESWPDYVFKPSYKRMTLDEVEKFININGHLPNVASATEMAATGNNLNKTDIKLLEKVEELTLYLLEMKKSNDAQNAEIQNLKKQVKSLKRK